MNRLAAIADALRMKNIPMVWVLLLIDSDEPLDFGEIMPYVVATKDFDILKVVLSLTSPFRLTKDQRLGCLVEAIRSCSIDVINYIWKPLEIDAVLRGPQPKMIADSIKMTGNREIIQKFIPYGNIFTDGSDVSDWLDKLASVDDINTMDLITNGAQDYFKHSPRNPLPYAQNAETVEYLLRHGANPNYRSPEGFTRLQMAIKEGDVRMIKLFEQFSVSSTQDEGQK
jgi:hypothetical protein